MTLDKQGQREPVYTDVGGNQKTSVSILQQIASDIMEAHNHAVDLGLVAAQFNSRVQGDIPATGVDAEKQREPTCTLEEIQSNISCLKQSLSNISMEIHRLENIG